MRTWGALRRQAQTTMALRSQQGVVACVAPGGRPLGLRWLSGEAKWGATGLKEALAEELAAEETPEESAEAKLKAALADVKHSLRTSEGSPVAEIEFPAQNATVSLDCRDTTDAEAYEDGRVGHQFELTIKKASGATLVFDLVALPEELDIAGVNYYATADDDDDSAYGGPKFDDLDANLQEAFYAYLEDLGFTDHFATAVHDFAAAKEVQEYHHWLNNVQKFLD